MVWLSLAWLVYVTAIAPVTVQIRFQWREGFQWQLKGHVWGVPFRLDASILQKKRTFSSQRNPSEWRAVYQLSRRRLQGLLERTRVEYADLRLWINTGRADLTALCWGVGKTLEGLIQPYLERRGIPAYIAVYPLFGYGSSAVEGGCILFTRLGNLLLAGLVLGLNVLRARRMLAYKMREEAGWITQSGA